MVDMDAEIAITGISGRFASCKNLEDFKEALLSGKDLMTDNHERWNHGFLKTPKSMGILPRLEFFDAKFFGINPKQATNMDPRTRQLIEVSFEAILDAGFNPTELRGSNTGVFLGALEDHNPEASLMARSTAVMANTISYCLDFKGPSLSANTGCSSSFYVMKQAVDSIINGECESAIVCGAQLHIFPHDSIELAALGVQDERCKAFDNDRGGYVKSEAVVAIYLQRQDMARRIYATVAGIGTKNDGYKVDGITHPSAESQIQLLEETYGKNGLDPYEVEYVEAHGTGTIVGDVKECQSLSGFFVDNHHRHSLKVGSVKTIAGHTESTAGLISLAKMLISIQVGIIPANLHFNTPAKDIPEIQKNKLMVVTKNTPYKGGLLGLNAFGLSGANSHVVLRPFYKKKQEQLVTKPQLNIVSGRTENAVDYLLTKLEENKNNHEVFSLINKIFEKPIKNFQYKGFSIIGTNVKEISRWSEFNTPIWFSYSGMGSQWPGMGRDLMYFEIFRNTIERCSVALEPYNINLKDIITNSTEEILNNPINCFPAIIAISIGLTDILHGLGIRPDGIIGHSLGEIGCAYADGLITAEQAVLIAYARGFATTQTKLTPGLMASVALSYKKCEDVLPEGVYIACHNFENNVTISGPEETVKQFVESLQKQGIFAKLVNTGNIAFHSKYIHEAGPLYLKILKTIIPTPKLRSAKWVPSAVKETEYESFLGQYNSAEYHHYNFMNPVLFCQVLKKVPKDCILIEIAPRGLLQAIFRRALSPSVEKLNLVSRDHTDNYEFLLSTIGKISLKHSVCLEKIFKQPNFPLGSTSPFISPMIQWDHKQKWKIPKYLNNNNIEGQKIIFDMDSLQNRYLFDHVVNDTCVFPGTGYIYLIWKALANITEADPEELPISIHSIKFLRPTVIPKTGDLTFTINILKSGLFEICNEGFVVSSGTVESNTSHKYHSNDVTSFNSDSEITMNADDFYKEMELRGHKYYRTFKSVTKCSVSGDIAKIQWKDNWIAFLDNMLQVYACFGYNNLVAPVEIGEININPFVHLNTVSASAEVSYIYDSTSKLLICGGIQIKNINVVEIGKRVKEENPELLKCQFIGNNFKYVETFDENQFEQSLRISSQIVIENNCHDFLLRVVEYEVTETNFYATVFRVVNKRHLKNLKYSKTKELTEIENSVNLLLFPYIDDEYKSLSMALSGLKGCPFIFTEIKNASQSEIPNNLKETIVFKCESRHTCFVLLRKPKPLDFRNGQVIVASGKDFKWVETVKVNLAYRDRMIYLVGKELDTGILGYFNCVKEEMQAENLRIFILEENSVEFCIKNDLYKRQLQKDLTVNVLMGKAWGTFRILPLRLDSKGKEMSSYRLEIKRNSVMYVEENPYRPLGKTEVHYTSLNNGHRAVRRSSILEDEQDFFGIEFSGLDKYGKNIMGISFNGTLKSHCAADRDYLVWQVPEYLSLEKAATIPLDYSLAYYSLFIKGNLKPQENILIIGTNNFALAASVLAINSDCNVFFAVKNNDESAKIKSVVPELPEERHIPLDFDLNDVHRKIKTNGFEFILNTTENVLLNFVQIVRDTAKVINFCDKEIDHNIINILLRKNCTIIPVSIELFLKVRFSLNNIKCGIQDLLNSCKIKVLPYRRVDAKYNSQEILDFMNNPTEEKLVIKIHADQATTQSPEGRRTYFDSENSYILVGGLGGIGLELVKWMARRGARKFVLNSRSGVTNGYQAFWVKKLTSVGAVININNYDILKIDEVEKIINVAKSIGPVDGIFNLPLVLENKPIEKLTEADFEKVVSPKLNSAQNFDVVSRKLCQNLQFFVMFSSIASLGSPLQANYGFANSALERLCETRKREKLPALAAAWGPIADVGYLANMKINKTFLGASPQGVDSCIAVLDKLLQHNNPVVYSVVYKDKEAGIYEAKDKNATELIASVLGVSCASISKNPLMPLVSLGLDSITSFELKSLFWQYFHIKLHPQTLRQLCLNDIEGLIQKNNSTHVHY